MNKDKKPPIQLLGTVTVGPKGQVVIPVDAREGMEISPGDKLVALYVRDKRSVAFVPESEFDEVVERMSQRFDAIKGLLKKN